MGRLRKHLHIKSVLVSVLLTFELSFLLDAFFVFSLGLVLPVYVWLILIAILFFTIFFLKISGRVKLIVFAGIAIVSVFVFAAAYFGIYIPFKENSVYNDRSVVTTNLFTDKKVMLVVPHEDDDLNLTGGVIEYFVHNNSTVYPVFVTNGDMFGQGSERIEEAIACWKTLGVAEENVFFLGYGDQWDDMFPHIYNAEPDTLLTSFAGNTETYGTDRHPPYHHSLYTHNNYKNDLQAIITEKRPDILFVTDYDPHPDHMAVSLMTEKVIGDILKDDPTYKPVIYKGYAYYTAWRAVNDFYALNLNHTVQSDAEANCYFIYDWADRVRFPLWPSDLSRSIFTTSMYDLLSIYETQFANIKTGSIVNSDKVFWQRRTDSLLYQADLKADSGNGDLLNDFVLLDSNDVRDQSRPPYDGVWLPADKLCDTVLVTFPSKVYIDQIYLYDHPSADDNITNMEILFDDGDRIETGPLCANGQATKICVQKTGVLSFRLRILAYEGNNPGMLEIETFDSPEQSLEPFIKFQDETENFIYDYILDSNIATFSLYSNNRIPEITADDYDLFSDNDACDIEIVDGKINISCSERGSYQLTARLRGTDIQDTVLVRNLNAWEKIQIKLGQAMEKTYVYPLSQNKHHMLLSYRLIEKFSAIF